jgi:thymidine kinase
MIRQTPSRSGWVEVIAGSMFSGKSEELIRRVRRAQIAKQKVQIFKPSIDARYDADHIVSHSDMKMPSEVVSSADEILARVASDTEVVGIDEGQFFKGDLVEAVATLANRGLRVIVAGLDQDYLGRPFEPIPQLMLAICMQCGAPANRSQRLVDASDRVVVGGAAEYEARCRACFKIAPARSDK